MPAAPARLTIASDRTTGEGVCDVQRLKRAHSDALDQARSAVGVFLGDQATLAERARELATLTAYLPVGVCEALTRAADDAKKYEDAINAILARK